MLWFLDWLFVFLWVFCAWKLLLHNKSWLPFHRLRWFLPLAHFDIRVIWGTNIIQVFLVPHLFFHLLRALLRLAKVHVLINLVSYLQVILWCGENDSWFYILLWGLLGIKRKMIFRRVDLSHNISLWARSRFNLSLSFLLIPLLPVRSTFPFVVWSYDFRSIWLWLMLIPFFNLLALSFEVQITLRFWFTDDL